MLQNVRNRSSDDTASPPRRTKCSTTLLQKRQISLRHVLDHDLVH